MPRENNHLSDIELYAYQTTHTEMSMNDIMVALKQPITHDIMQY